MSARRRRFAQAAAIVVAGAGLCVVWMVAHRGDHPRVQRVVVAPGDDPPAIVLPVEKAHFVEIDRTGALLVHVGARVERQPSPRAYQDIGGSRRNVSVRFDIAPVGDPRFVVGPYDHTLPLIIESVGAER